MYPLPASENNNTEEQGPKSSQRVIGDQMKGQMVKFH